MLPCVIPMEALQLRHMSVTAIQITGIWTVFLTAWSAKSNENINVLHYWSSVTGRFPHKWPVMWITFPYHDINMIIRVVYQIMQPPDSLKFVFGSVESSASDESSKEIELTRWYLEVIFSLWYYARNTRMLKPFAVLGGLTVRNININQPENVMIGAHPKKFADLPGVTICWYCDDFVSIALGNISASW